MYCRNCKNVLNDDASICGNCGVPVGTGYTYCDHCGSPTIPEAVVCPACGCAINNCFIDQKRKSKMTAALLAVLFPFGVHSFYLGFTGRGIAQVLLSFCGIGLVWSFIEGILILAGAIKEDAYGLKFKD